MESKGSFIIHGQYIKDLSFENPNAPDSLMAEEKPQINISLDVKVEQINEATFEVTLLCHIKADAADKNMFIVELSYAGLFAVEAEEDEELERLLLVQCPHYLFPFVRRIVSDMTRDGGFIPLLLQPVDFFGLYLQKKGTVNDNATVN